MAPLELGVIRHRPPVPIVKFFGQRCPNIEVGLDSVGRRSQRQTHLTMNLLLLLALAVPLSCLAFLSLLAFLGVMTLGAVIHVLGTVRARWPRPLPHLNREAESQQSVPQEPRIGPIGRGFAIHQCCPAQAYSIQ